MTKNNTFWLYDITQLFKSTDLIPKTTDLVNDKLNTIMRLSIVACTIIAVYKPILALNTLLIIAVMTITIHSTTTIESFEELNTPLEIFMKEYLPGARSAPSLQSEFGMNYLRFCNDDVPYEYSLNGTLVGDANPKTKIPPLVAIPSYDSEWKLNDFVVNPSINAHTTFDSYRSGYESSPVFVNVPVRLATPKPCYTTTHAAANDATTHASANDATINSSPSVRPKVPNETRPSISVQEPESAARDNLLTQTLQPGVFQKSYVGEPIQSNIGISYLQEFLPTSIQQTSDDIKYTQYPNDSGLSDIIEKRPVSQNIFNIYDPRFTGYGTGYRSYVDKMDRPQFFYDDINSITMPNYIVRSKVDSFPWADSYGNEMLPTDNFKSLANNAFTDSTILFRTEMQERLMRKRNAELWQRRAFPISTMNKVSYLAR